MIDLPAKIAAVAEMLDGRVLNNQDSGLAVCANGSILGFPAALQAISPGWPFGITYVIETEVIEDPNKPHKDNVLNLVIYPRVGHGLLSIFTRVFLFESKGLSVGDKRLESKFVLSFNDKNVAERLAKYPGVSDLLLNLEELSKFNELTIKTDAGIVLSQPKSFNALDLDQCRATFKILGELGQIIFEAF